MQFTSWRIDIRRLRRKAGRTLVNDLIKCRLQCVTAARRVSDAVDDPHRRVRQGLDRQLSFASRILAYVQPVATKYSVFQKYKSAL
jgi:hypothetical protein